MKFTSPVYSAVSGSTAGITYSRNKGGMYTRARAVPTNPNTARQQLTRSYMGAAVQLWSEDLTENMRNSWRNYAANTPVLDKLGQMKHLSGQQMWVKWYVAMAYAGGDTSSISMSGPNNTGEPPMGLVGKIDPDPMIGIFASNSEWNSQILLQGDASEAARVTLYISPPLNAGVSYYKGPYQRVQNFSISSGTNDVDVQTTFASELDDTGPLVVGQRRGVKITVVYIDGRVAQPYHQVLTVTEQTTP